MPVPGPDDHYSAWSPLLGTSGRQTYTTSAPYASRFPYPSQGNTNCLPSPHQMTAEAPQGKLRCCNLVQNSKSLHLMLAAFPRLPIVDTTSQAFQCITTKAEREISDFHLHTKVNGLGYTLQFARTGFGRPLGGIR